MRCSGSAEAVSLSNAPFLLPLVLVASCATPVVPAGESEPTIEACTHSRPDMKPRKQSDRCFVVTKTGHQLSVPRPGQRIVLATTPEDGPPPGRLWVEQFLAPTLTFAPGLQRRAGEPVRVPYGLHWSPTVEGLFFLHWTNGFVGGTLCLRETNDGLSGEADDYSDAGRGNPRQIVVLQEQPCDALALP